MYNLFSRLTKLPSAADALARSDQVKLSPFVFTAYDELTLSSAQNLVACMRRHGVQPDTDVFFDVGSGYGRGVCHVALTTGMAACGIEAVPARHRQARECVASCWALDGSKVHLYEGDILDNLHLLLPATYAMMFDARFQPETRFILRHLWAHLAGSKLRLLLCMKPRETRGVSSTIKGAHYHPAGFEPVDEVAVTTGQNNFNLCAYRPTPDNSTMIEVAVFPGGRVGVRARYSMSAGSRIVNVVGERLSTSRWSKLHAHAANTRWQWALKRDQKWIHILSIARFVNAPVGEDPCNATFVVEERECDGEGVNAELICIRDAVAGEEILADGGEEACTAEAVPSWVQELSPKGRAA